MIQRLAILGVGLMGGSLALALREAHAVRQVVGYGRSRSNLETALTRGILDEIATSLSAAVAGADMVVIAAPVAQIGSLLRDIAPGLAPTAVVTDVGSVKGAIAAQAREMLGDRFPDFVPGHPVAGAEKSGADAAAATLYRGARVVLTPEPATRAGAVARVEAMWRATGAQVQHLSAKDHDAIFARVSHLPHVLAFALVDMLARDPSGQAPSGSALPEQALMEFAAGGFRDFSRIASSSPEMWSDICAYNAPAISQALREYRACLDSILKLLEESGPDRPLNLMPLFTHAKQARDAWLEKRPVSP